MDKSLNECANCRMHRWTPVEDESKLQLCAKCELIKYCGKDCQTEHWKKVHKMHCNYFKDPTIERQWEHKLVNCPICLQAAVVGPLQLRQPSNANYKCIFEYAMNIPPPFVHPHPFPAAGQPGDTAEKAIIVLCQLLQKFVLTQPWTNNCPEMFEKVFLELAAMRVRVWSARKVMPEMGFTSADVCSPVNLLDIENEVEKNEGTEDPFELWYTILRLNDILDNLGYSVWLNVLIDPLADIPAEFHALISQALGNNDKYLATVNKVLEALATQVVPFKDVQKIICDDASIKTCHFCSEEKNDANEGVSADEGVPFEGALVFNCLYMGIYCRARSKCRELVTSFEKDFPEFKAAMVAVMQERSIAMCDKCFRMPPVKDVHRCNGCLSVQYCTKKCLYDDWPIHSLVCKEAVEERKVKFGKSGRRKAARDDLKKLLKRVPAYEVDIQEATKLMARLRPKDKDDHIPT